jgi:hypothetical protein
MHFFLTTNFDRLLEMVIDQYLGEPEGLGAVGYRSGVGRLWAFKLHGGVGVVAEGF